MISVLKRLYSSKEREARHTNHGIYTFLLSGKGTMQINAVGILRNETICGSGTIMQNVIVEVRI